MKTEKKSETLARLWPAFFSEPKPDVLTRCLLLLEEIEVRYNQECNPHITRKQVAEIQALISEIKPIDLSQKL